MELVDWYQMAQRLGGGRGPLPKGTLVTERRDLKINHLMLLLQISKITHTSFKKINSGQLHKILEIKSRVKPFLLNDICENPFSC